MHTMSYIYATHEAMNHEANDDERLSRWKHKIMFDTEYSKRAGRFSLIMNCIIPALHNLVHQSHVTQTRPAEMTTGTVLQYVTSTNWFSKRQHADYVDNDGAGNVVWQVKMAWPTSRGQVMSFSRKSLICLKIGDKDSNGFESKGRQTVSQ